MNVVWRYSYDVTNTSRDADLVVDCQISADDLVVISSDFKKHMVLRVSRLRCVRGSDYVALSAGCISCL